MSFKHEYKDFVLKKKTKLMSTLRDYDIKGKGGFETQLS